MNIFEAIREDHDRHRKMLSELVDTSGKTNTRTSIFNKIKEELKIHAKIEERHFYIPLIEKDMTQEHARHGVHEHHEIDELIGVLEETEMDSPAWLVHAKSLKEEVEHHLEDEERTIFQLAGKVLSETQKTSLAKEYISAREQHLSLH